MKALTARSALRAGLLAAVAACADQHTTAPTAAIPSSTSQAIQTGQSPIDLIRDEIVKRDLPDLRFRFNHRARLDVENTGSPDENATVRANVVPGDGQLRIGNRSYKLLQFHWHTPSEHEVQGRDFPLEMHLVHQAGDGSLLVVGVFIRRGSAHRELAKIFNNLPEHPGDRTIVRRFNLARLLPQRLSSIRYSGSLTTPPFTEGVSWVVLTKPIEMSSSQIHAFQELFEEGNSREVQPLNDRRVVLDGQRRSDGRDDRDDDD